MAALRRLLDLIYRLSGVAAALCLVTILVLIVLQMLARWTGEVFPGVPQYAGYFMAAASFLAFGNALNQGSHIRVSLVLNALPEGARRWLDIWCFAIGTAVAWYVVYYGYRFVYWSWKFNEVSQGQDRTALWIPQCVVLVGAVIFAVALTDNLLSLIFGGKSRIVQDRMDQSFGE